MIKNLEVWIVPVLTFKPYLQVVVKHVCLKKIAKIRHILSFKSAEILICAFDSLCIDYCNTPFNWLPRKSCRGLQTVLKSDLSCFKAIWETYEVSSEKDMHLLTSWTLFTYMSLLKLLYLKTIALKKSLNHKENCW